MLLVDISSVRLPVHGSVGQYPPMHDEFEVDGYCGAHRLGPWTMLLPSGPQSPLAVLTPLVDELRAKKTLALGGAARVRDLEAEAVQTLGSLALVE